MCCGSVRVIHHEHVSTRVNGVQQSKVFESARSSVPAQVGIEAAGEAIFAGNRVAFADELPDWIRDQFTRTRYRARPEWRACRLQVRVRSGYAFPAGRAGEERDEDGGDDSREAIGCSATGGLRARRYLYRNFGAYKVGFTMLETDGIPAEWVRQANLMDEVWCPSQFNVKTFRDSGVTRPIHAIPLGIDPGYFNPQIRTSRVSERYTFLSVFEWGERKAPELLLRAFNEEFRFDEPVVLVCKILNADTSVDVHDQIRKLD